MIDVQPMLRATTLICGLVLCALGAAGWGSLGLVASVGVSMANLVALATLVPFYSRAVARGEPGALGLLVLHGKSVILVGSLCAVGSVFGAESAVGGFFLVTTAFTLAVGGTGFLNASKAPVEAL